MDLKPRLARPIFDGLPEPNAMTETANPTHESGTLAPERVRRILQQNGLDVPDERWALLECWAELLRDHNQRINLISRKEEGVIWEKHVLPCLALLCLREFPEAAEVCDFGTGGGLPGVPMAIVRPDVRVTLLDSRQKKIASVQQMIEQLGLENAQTVLGRGEDLGKVRPWRERFPLLTARAVAPLSDLLRWTRLLCTPDAVLHVFKGGEFRDEVVQASRLFPGFKLNKSLMVLKGYSELAENQKFIATVHVGTILPKALRRHS